MIRDALTTFSNAQTFDASPGILNVSDGVIDLLQNRDIGQGEALEVQFLVTTAFAGAGNLRCQIVVADAESLLVGAVILTHTENRTVAQLTLGSTFSLVVPRFDFTTTDNLAPGARFLGLNYSWTGASLTAGAITASLVLTGNPSQERTAGGVAFYPVYPTNQTIT